MASENKRQLGAFVEKQCTEFLQKNNIKILALNFRSKSGEIDIIGFGDPCENGPLKNKGYWIFFEVKYRKNQTAGWAEQAVGYSKQKTICQVSDYYRLVNKIDENAPIRYDVLAINGEEIKWYKNAFDYIKG